MAGSRRSGGGTAPALDLALFNGQILYANGETGAYAGVEVIDTANGNDRGYVMTVLEDGSVSVQLVQGKETSKQGSRIVGTGTWEMVTGSGRFAKSPSAGSYIWEVDGDKWRAEFDAW